MHNQHTSQQQHNQRAPGAQATSDAIPSVFVVRAERRGEAEETDLRDGVCSIGWHDTPNPFYHTKAEIEAYGATHWLDEQGKTAPDAPKMIWHFAHAPELNQAIIVLPRLHPQHRGEVLLGRCHSTAYWDYDAAGTDESPRLRRRMHWSDIVLQWEDFSEQTQNWFRGAQHTVTPARQVVVAQDIAAHAAALALL
ncbi:MAG TPA: hypothetical protein VF116_16130 [Ktedonobacterales bacterium]